jgi:hypothetical protein
MTQKKESQLVNIDDYFHCDDCELYNLCKENSRLHCTISNTCDLNSGVSCTPIETFLGIISTLFGTVLLLPFDTFQSHAYHTLVELADEYIWGAVCLFVGILQLLTVIINKRRFFKVLSLTLQAFIWSFVGTMLLVNDLILGGTLNTGVTTYLTIAGLALYTAYRLG